MTQWFAQVFMVLSLVSGSSAYAAQTWKDAHRRSDFITINEDGSGEAVLKSIGHLKIKSGSWLAGEQYFLLIGEVLKSDWHKIGSNVEINGGFFSSGSMTFEHLGDHYYLIKQGQ